MRLRIFFLLPVFIFAISCSSTDKLIRKGQYDKAFKKALKRVVRNPQNEKEVYNLALAYNKAQQNTEERIKELVATGSPDIWDEVYNDYTLMKYRYEKIKPVLPLKYKGKILKVEKKDYSGLANEAKKKAAEYHYALGKKYMRSGTKQDYRRAYYEFSDALSYFQEYKDARKLREDAYRRGLMYVAVFAVNHSKYRIPVEFYDKLFDFDLSRINRTWTKFEFYKGKDKPKGYDGFVKIVIDDIQISPERVENNTYTVEKTIQVGEDYVRDENGHILTDSSGNPLTQPVMGKAVCIVKETHLKKDAFITSTMYFINVPTHEILKKIPAGAEQHFDYAFAQANGDLRVLDDRVRELLNNKPVPFPPDEVMIRDLFENLSQAVEDNIYRYRRIWE